MEKVYIVAAKRTPIGSFLGSLKNFSASKLAAASIKGAVDSIGLSVDEIDEVIVGNVISAAQGMNVGRQASIYADIPAEVPAYTLNMVCGSGMKVVMDAVAHIRAGDAQVVVASGVEVMSQIPTALPASTRQGQKMGNFALTDLLINDGLTDVFNNYHMGVTAENVAKQVGISREEQDKYALASQQKAVAAIKAGRFVDEIVPIDIITRRTTTEFSTDEYPKADASYESLSGLRPAFDKEGTVTAGNASGINDGASTIIIASESAVERLGLNPLAEIVSSAQVGLDPSVMGLGPVGAVSSVLEKSALSIKDINVFELNEAFAAQALGVAKQLAFEHKIPMQSILDKANFNGGAIALGHPLGASGNRILVSLVHELQRQQEEYGIASLCVGGGMGTAVLVKRC